jgi:hypothetical protein
MPYRVRNVFWFNGRPMHRAFEAADEMPAQEEEGAWKEFGRGLAQGVQGNQY